MHEAVEAWSAVTVDPVPWARSQMAFTLAFHIILVPLGVSWSVMALIANHRGIRRGVHRPNGVMRALASPRSVAAW